tara:strand:+ start:107 stop:724 length:618 start_codon:yes stop_codon:yes gene_type:complete
MHNHKLNFLPVSDKLDFYKILNNYEKIKQDYLEFSNMGVHFDYSHEYDLTKDISELSLPLNTGYFWQVCPLVFKREIVPFMPSFVYESFTTKLLMSLKIKPVLAIFSIFEPYSEIPSHIDMDDEIVCNTKNIPYQERETSVVKYHLSLDIPSGNSCSLVVNNENKVLKNGDLNIFDETNPHWAYNQSPQRRGVLIVSYLRNELYI